MTIYLGGPNGITTNKAEAQDFRGPPGEGDLSGPGATVVDGEIAVFDGTTGSAVKGAGVSVADIKNSIPDPVAMAIVFGA